MFLRKNGFATAAAKRLAWRVAAPMAICAASLVAAPASAASLTGPISGWASGNVPSTDSMYEYVPDNLAPNPPIMVLLHYCGGNAAGVFGEAEGGGLVAAADQYGFLIVVPQTTNNCWDCGSTTSMTHNAGGDTLAVVEQVQYAIKEHNADANRVYVTGTSSGAMMTEAMLAVYPEVFKAGSEFSGVPAGCWGVDDPNGQWSGPCAGGSVTNTAQQWGMMVQMMDPGYTGFRPRIQLWHGEADGTISYTNQTQAILEWTDVLGLPTMPSSTQSITFSGHQYMREQWQDACGYTVLDAWSEVNGPHGTDANFNAMYTIPFLALDQTGATDPEVAQCEDAGGASSGGAMDASISTNEGGEADGGAGGSSGSSTSSSGESSGGTAGGNGGSSGSAGTGGNGSGGDTTSSGNSTASSTGGASAPYRPGSSCDLAGAPGANDAFAWAGIMALNVVLGRLRRAKRA